MRRVGLKCFAQSNKHWQEKRRHVGATANQAETRVQRLRRSSEVAKQPSTVLPRKGVSRFAYFSPGRCIPCPLQGAPGSEMKRCRPQTAKRQTYLRKGDVPQPPNRPESEFSRAMAAYAASPRSFQTSRQSADTAAIQHPKVVRSALRLCYCMRLHRLIVTS